MEILGLKKQIFASKKGFTLVEVLVFTAIASLIFLAAASLSLVSVNRLKSQQYKVWGNYFMDSLFEWLAGEKEKDWDTFFSKASDTGKTYCFNSLDINYPDSADGWPPEGECSDFSLGKDEIFNGKSLFKREAKLIVDGERVKAVVVVSWKERGGVKSVKGARTFSFIEQ